MKLTISELKDDNKEIYNKFLEQNTNSPHLMFFHAWEWGEFLKETSEDFKRLGVYKDDQLVAVCQAALKKFRFGQYWYSPRGVLLDYNDNKLVENVHGELYRYLKLHSNPSFFRVDPNIIEGDKIIKTFDRMGSKKAGIFIQAQRVWQCDVFDNEETQLQWLKDHGMKKKLPNQVRKGLREGVTFRASDDLVDIDLLTGLLRKLDVRKGGIGKRSDDYYKQQFSCMSQAGHEKLFIAERNGKILAVNLFAIYNEEACYLHGASSDEDRELSAPAILHIKSMVYIKQNYPGVKRYNFWGVVSQKKSKPGNPHIGYSDFKRGFGGYEVVYEEPRDFVYKYVNWRMCWLVEKYRKLKLKNY